jgi:hypothetical protein
MGSCSTRKMESGIDVESRTVDPNDILGISDTSPHEEIYKPTMGHQTHGKTEDHSGYS